jgi:hypothetical protein
VGISSVFELFNDCSTSGASAYERRGPALGTDAPTDTGDGDLSPRVNGKS